MSSTKQNRIPVIDLFAGPGGLGEGFASFSPRNSGKFENLFNIALSIEMENFAHETLQLRSFFRKFPKGKAPEEYYQYLRGEISKKTLFNAFPKQKNLALKEAVKRELGKDDDVKELIESALHKHSEHEKVLIGGPPCQAYSLMGRSRMNGNKEKFEKDKRHFLYQEYLKVITQVQPAVFVMENVKGILSSKVKGEQIFPKILKDFHSPAKALELSDMENLSYSIWPLEPLNQSIKDPLQAKSSDFIVKSEHYGLPQARHRVILLGIRSDILKKIGKPECLSESNTSFTLSQAISDLPEIRSTLSRGKDSASSWKEAIISIEEEQWFNNLKKPELKNFIQEEINRLKQSILPKGQEVYCPERNETKSVMDELYRKWYLDPRLTGCTNHCPKGHMKTDLHRYFFASCYAKVHKISPKIKDFPEEIWPAHNNVKKGPKNPIFADRFRVQLDDKPSSTITSHMAKDGHYYIHPDPQQCRSLTVREAARLQTFPDNYFFEGPRTAQHRQVGNAVPPFLARQIAEVVYKIFQKAGIL